MLYKELIVCQHSYLNIRCLWPKPSTYPVFYFIAFISLSLCLQVSVESITKIVSFTGTFTRLKVGCKKITTLFKLRISIIIWSFSS